LYRLLLAVTILLAPELRAQDSTGNPNSRLAQIQQERVEKAASLSTPEPAKTPGPFSRLAPVFQYVPIGFDVGGLGTGAWPAINLRFRKSMYDERLSGTAWGHLTFRYFYSVGTGAEYRSGSKQDLTFSLQGSYANSPQLDYYGPGPNSSIHNHTNFLREDTLFNFRAGLKTSQNLAEACHIGQLLQHVGPGTSGDLPTTQSVFGPAQAPGIEKQSNYLIPGCSVDLDLRDFPEDPHKGTHVLAAFDRYYAEDASRFSFYRVSLLGEQFIPFFNRKRVIVLRGRTELNYHSTNQVVPFYLQPTLGSDTDLRGYSRYRFYDEDMLSVTAEYRWEIGTGFDMALFVDGGDVFHRPSQISLFDVKNSFGFGLRFKNQSERRVIARLDTGFSREGFQIWLRVPEFFF
jgi:outer membrane protein assembly factor BamA